MLFTLLYLIKYCWFLTKKFPLQSDQCIQSDDGGCNNITPHHFASSSFSSSFFFFFAFCLLQIYLLLFRIVTQQPFSPLSHSHHEALQIINLIRIGALLHLFHLFYIFILHLEPIWMTCFLLDLQPKSEQDAERGERVSLSHHWFGRWEMNSEWKITACHLHLLFFFTHPASHCIALGHPK